MRNQAQTTKMQEQMPKHYFVADEIKQHPSKENRMVVLVRDLSLIHISWNEQTFVQPASPFVNSLPTIPTGKRVVQMFVRSMP